MLRLARLLEDVQPGGTGKAQLLDPDTGQPDGSAPVDVRNRYGLMRAGLCHVASIGGSRYELIQGVWACQALDAIKALQRG